MARMTNDEALKLSIMHWEENATARKPLDIDVSVGSCALCNLHFKEDCLGCPIRNVTKRSFCNGTPYYTVLDTAKKWRDDYDNYNDTTESKKACIDACKAEAEFLRGLRV